MATAQPSQTRRPGLLTRQGGQGGRHKGSHLQQLAWTYLTNTGLRMQWESLWAKSRLRRLHTVDRQTLLDGLML